MDGEFAFGGMRVKTGFRLFKEHVAGYPPDWAAGICDVPADSIRRLARELGQNAMIGCTTVVESKTLPYRPVAIMGYHVAQQELGANIRSCGN